MFFLIVFQVFNRNSSMILSVFICETEKSHETQKPIGGLAVLFNFSCIKYLQACYIKNIMS